jgi:peroxiredoxin
MAVLTPGNTAPDFNLPGIDGKPYSLREALSRGPVVVAFFKISCPVCQYAFPFLERIYQAHGNQKLNILGISQNEKKETAAFLKEFGVSFPVLLEDTERFQVSNAYGLTNVPTVLWISSDGIVEISSVGWSRQDMDDLNRKAGEAAGGGPRPLFEPAERAAEFRAG